MVSIIVPKDCNERPGIDKGTASCPAQTPPCTSCWYWTFAKR
jgi:hypothetical protein